MTVERTTTVDQSDPDWGRYDPGCVGKPNPADTEPYPVPFNRMSDAMQGPQSRMDALDQDLGSKVGRTEQTATKAETAAANARQAAEHLEATSHGQVVARHPAPTFPFLLAFLARIRGILRCILVSYVGAGGQRCLT